MILNTNFSNSVFSVREWQCGARQSVLAQAQLRALDGAQRVQHVQGLVRRLAGSPRSARLHLRAVARRHALHIRVRELRHQLLPAQGAHTRSGALRAWHGQLSGGERLVGARDLSLPGARLGRLQAEALAARVQLQPRRAGCRHSTTHRVQRHQFGRACEQPRRRRRQHHCGARRTQPVRLHANVHAQVHEEARLRGERAVLVLAAGEHVRGQLSLHSGHTRQDRVCARASQGQVGRSARARARAGDGGAHRRTRWRPGHAQRGRQATLLLSRHRAGLLFSVGNILLLSLLFVSYIKDDF